MKPLLERLAYKLCSTEVKMLIDKLEECGHALGVGRNSVYLSGLPGIAENGRFTIGERIALALLIRRHYRTNTKAAIAQSIFEGEMKERQENIAGAFTTTTGSPYVPGETLSTRKITEQALRVLEQQMDNTKQWTEADKHYREQGML